MAGVMNRAAVNSWLAKEAEVRSTLERIFVESGRKASDVQKWTEAIIRNSYDPA